MKYLSQIVSKYRFFQQIAANMMSITLTIIKKIMKTSRRSSLKIIFRQWQYTHKHVYHVNKIKYILKQKYQHSFKKTL